MLNEVPVTDKMIKITNKNKESSNNKKTEKSIVDNALKENNEYIHNNELFAYDKEEEKSEEENKKFFFKLFSTKNNSDNSIIKKKNYKLKEKKEKKSKKSSKNPISTHYTNNSANVKPSSREEVDYLNGDGLYYLSNEDKDNKDYDNSQIPKPIKEKEKQNIKKVEKNNSKTLIKKEFKFDEFILNQDIIEGYWTKDSQCETLIEEEEKIYDKIKKYSEDKGINDENGIITLFFLYYIYHKKTDKIFELKSVINKAKILCGKGF